MKVNRKVEKNLTIMMGKEKITIKTFFLLRNLNTPAFIFLF